MKILTLLIISLFFLISAEGRTPVQKSPYARKVKRTSAGEVYIRTSVKRQKGETCNPTSMSMILNYFGIFASSSELQRASGGSDAYKYSAYLEKELAKYNMKMLFIPVNKKDHRAFHTVMRAINCGLPLQWLVDLLKAPDYDINRKQKAALAAKGPVAGHARVLNGYRFNKKNRRLEGFIFTDPWGARRQEIKLADTAHMTLGFFLIFPAKINPGIIHYILSPVYGKR